MKKRDLRKYQGIVFKIIDNEADFDNTMPDNLWSLITECVKQGNKKAIVQMFQASNQVIKDGIKEAIKNKFKEKGVFKDESN